MREFCQSNSSIDSVFWGEDSNILPSAIDFKSIANIIEINLIELEVFTKYSVH